MKTGKTPGYILTFRCVNCGIQELFADLPSEDSLTEDEIRARIYRASCNSCGWQGSACGLSAVRISYVPEPHAKAAGREN
jgi:hypothetical protein